MLRRTVWGLDLGRSAVKGVLLAAAKERTEILEAGIVPLEGPPPDPSLEPTLDGRLWKALHAFRQQHRMQGVPVCLAIPAQNTFIRDLTVARVGRRKIEQMVRFEASNEIPFVLDEVIWDYTLYPEVPSAPTREGLLLAVKKSAIGAYVRVMDEFEIGPVEQITIAPLALLNFIHLELGGSGRALALDVGAENTNILAVEDGRFWVRNMLSGGNRVTALLEEEFELPFDKAQRAKENVARSRYADRIVRVVRPAVDNLVRDLKTNLSYMEPDQGASGFDAVYVTGGGCRLPGLKQTLSRALRNELQDIRRLRHLTLSPEADAGFISTNMDRLATAVGAGLSVLGHDVTAVSFLPPEQLRAARLGRTRGILLALAVAAWAVALTLWLFAARLQAGTEGPLERYQKLAQTYSSQRRRLSAAEDTVALESELQYLLGLSAGQDQIYRLANDVAGVFAAAGGEGGYTFQIASFECGISEETSEPEPSSRLIGPRRRPPVAVVESAVRWITGRIEGGMVPSRRGADEPYAPFRQRLLDGLRELPAFRTAAGRASFTAGETTVEAAEADWLRLVRPGDLIRTLPDGEWEPIAEVETGTRLKLAAPFDGETGEADYAVCRVRMEAFDLETRDFTIAFEVPAQQPVALDELLDRTETP